MALVELQRRGVLKHLVSQNCDGLHRRSGYPSSALSELHGNRNVEECEECGQQYFRDEVCKRISKRDHFTGRFCANGCCGRLLEWSVDFGQKLPERPLKLAYEHAKLSDVHLALGSSLSISPANDMPRLGAKYGELVIVNLQKTPLTQAAAFQIYAPCDTVTAMLMDRLGYGIPPFELHRRIVVGAVAESGQRGSGGMLYARGADPEIATLPVQLLSAAQWHTIPSAPSTASPSTRRGSSSCRLSVDGDLRYDEDACEYRVKMPPGIASDAKYEVTVSFNGHYDEPDLTLQVPSLRDPSQEEAERDACSSHKDEAHRAGAPSIHADEHPQALSSRPVAGYMWSEGDKVGQLLKRLNLKEGEGIVINRAAADASTILRDGDVVQLVMTTQEQGECSIATNPNTNASNNGRNNKPVPHGRGMPPRAAVELAYDVAFNPAEGEWRVVTSTPTDALVQPEAMRDGSNQYGKSHREYVLDGLEKHPEIQDRAEAADYFDELRFEQKSKEMKRRARSARGGSRGARAW